MTGTDRQTDTHARVRAQTKAHTHREKFSFYVNICTKPHRKQIRPIVFIHISVILLHLLIYSYYFESTVGCKNVKMCTIGYVIQTLKP